VEGREADVGNLLFTEDEALISYSVQRVRDIGGRHRRCGRTTRKRKAKSRGTQCWHGGGLGHALPFRSLLHPRHRRILPSLQEVFSNSSGKILRLALTPGKLDGFTNPSFHIQFLFILMNATMNGKCHEYVCADRERVSRVASLQLIVGAMEAV
jgi:hypothetical protein